MAGAFRRRYSLVFTEYAMSVKAVNFVTARILLFFSKSAERVLTVFFHIVSAGLV